MQTQAIPFGTIVIGEVAEVHRTERGLVTIFVGDDNGAYIIVGVNHDVPPGHAKIRFDKGGPLGGYWQPLPLDYQA